MLFIILAGLTYTNIKHQYYKVPIQINLSKYSPKYIRQLADFQHIKETLFAEESPVSTEERLLSKFKAINAILKNVTNIYFTKFDMTTDKLFEESEDLERNVLMLYWLEQVSSHMQ